MAASIVTDKLTKRYGHTEALALDKLSISIAEGEIYGFLGANGAGKSTTIRLLMNFLQPTSGSAQIMGYDSVKRSARLKSEVGYLAGEVALYPKVTGRELLDYLSRLQRKVDKKYRRQLEQRFEAELDKPIGALSKGNRQKIGILQAFMHQPQVLILDEPTSGLDPLMQEAFYETLRESKQRGAAVLMSSHNLDEAQRVCDRVGIIKQGKLIREQSVGGSLLGAPIFTVTFHDPSALMSLKKASTVKLIKQEGNRTANLQPTRSIAEALATLARYDIQKLESRSVSLEDEFLEFYGGEE